MVEHAIHVWDVLHWLTGELPVRANGWGRRDLYAASDPGRDVTDHYSVDLEWADGFRASFQQSWIAPASEEFTGSTFQVLGEDGGIDFNSGGLTYRDRNRKRRAIHPGLQPDTRLSLEGFLKSIRSADEGGSSRSTIPCPYPSSALQEARAATLIGLLVRKAVDERRPVSIDEIRAECAQA
jgi:predicted dehydrogenase